LTLAVHVGTLNVPLGARAYPVADRVPRLTVDVEGLAAQEGSMIVAMLRPVVSGEKTTWHRINGKLVKYVAGKRIVL
jgi:hypothetical protein